VVEKLDFPFYSKKSTMKNLKYVIPGMLFMISSCLKSKTEIEGVWVNKNVKEVVDTLTIKNIKENPYLVALKSWKKGKKRVKNSTGTYVENVLKLDNKNVLIYTENKELIIGEESLIYNLFLLRKKKRNTLYFV